MEVQERDLRHLLIAQSPATSGDLERLERRLPRIPVPRGKKAHRGAVPLFERFAPCIPATMNVSSFNTSARGQWRFFLFRDRASSGSVHAEKAAEGRQRLFLERALKRGGGILYNHSI